MRRSRLATVPSVRAHRLRCHKKCAHSRTPRTGIRAVVRSHVRRSLASAAELECARARTPSRATTPARVPMRARACTCTRECTHQGYSSFRESKPGYLKKHVMHLPVSEVLPCTFCTRTRTRSHARRWCTRRRLGTRAGCRLCAGQSLSGHTLAHSSRRLHQG